MPRSVIRLALAAWLSTLVSAGFASAQGVFVGPPPSIVDPQPLTGLRRHVAQELRFFGYGDVDVSTLSNRNVVLIDNVIHSNYSHSRKHGQIGSILSRGGILQRAIDGLSGR